MVSSIFSNYNWYLLYSEQNYCIFVYEDAMWAVKGPYETAIIENEGVEWETEKNAHMLRLLIVGLFMHG
jgi:hypothetical protein